jgi:hypothetical protein
MITLTVIQDTLDFQEQIDLRPFYLTVIDNLVLIEDYRSNYVSVSDALDFSDSIGLARTIGVGVADTVVFDEHLAARAYIADYSEIMIFTDTFIGHLSKPTIDNLSFTESIIGMRSRVTADLLSFAEVIGLEKHLTLTVSDTLNLVEGRTGFIPDANFIGISVPPCS